MCDLTQVEFGFLMSGMFDLTDTKNINISLRSCFLKSSLSASFPTRNFDEIACNILHRSRPCRFSGPLIFTSTDLFIYCYLFIFFSRKFGPSPFATYGIQMILYFMILIFYSLTVQYAKTKLNLVLVWMFFKKIKWLKLLKLRAHLVFNPFTKKGETE